MNLLPREWCAGFVFLARGGPLAAALVTGPGPAGWPMCYGCLYVPIWAWEIFPSRGRDGLGNHIGVDVTPQPTPTPAPPAMSRLPAACGLQMRVVGSGEHEMVRWGWGLCWGRCPSEVCGRDPIVTFRAAGHFMDRQFLWV